MEDITTEEDIASIVTSPRVTSQPLQCEPGAPYPRDPPWMEFADMAQYFETEIPEPYPTWEVALKITAYVIAMGIGITGNIMVLLILIWNKNMRTSTNVYIANLAISDLMVCLSCMWIHLGYNITISWPFGSFFCTFNSFFQGWMAMASILILLVISCDRFFAIIFPLKARLTRMRCVLLLALVWVASGAISAPNLAYTVMYELQWSNWREVWCEENWPKYWYIAVNEEGEQYCDTESPARQGYLIFTVVLLYMVPVALMTGAYGIMAHKLWTRRMPGEQSGQQVQHQLKSRKKVVRMLIIVLLVFVICWTPFHCLRLWDVLRYKNESPAEYIVDLRYAMIYLAYFNSALNPILYAGFNDNFRRGFWNMFRCKRCKRNQVSPDNDGTMLFGQTRVTQLRLGWDSIRRHLTLTRSQTQNHTNTNTQTQNQTQDKNNTGNKPPKKNMTSHQKGTINDAEAYTELVDDVKQKSPGLPPVQIVLPFAASSQEESSSTCDSNEIKRMENISALDYTVEHKAVSIEIESLESSFNATGTPIYLPKKHHKSRLNSHRSDKTRRVTTFAAVIEVEDLEMSSEGGSFEDTQTGNDVTPDVNKLQVPTQKRM